MSIKTIPVCPSSSIPAREMRCVSLQDRNVLVANTDNGIIVADEMCTHEDARLCDGNLTGSLVKCPLHGSRFDLANGAVLDDPATEPLRIYPSRVEQDMLYIDIDSSHPNEADK